MYMLIADHEFSGREVFQSWKTKPTLKDFVSDFLNDDHRRELLRTGHTVVYATDYFGEADRLDFYLYEAHRLGSSHGQTD